METQITQRLADLAFGFAHKVRNPLGIINSAAQFCIAYPQRKDKAEEHLQNIVKSVRNIEDALKNIMEFCQPLRLNEKTVSVKELLDRLCYSIEDKFKFGRIKLVKEYQNISLDIAADPNLLCSAFEQVALNSYESMPDGGTFTIEAAVEPEKNDLRIKFIDTGAGISRQDIQRGLFQPFYTTKEGKLGLGLCTAEKIIEEHGGRIEIDSEVGKGTAVIVNLPVLKPGM